MRVVSEALRLPMIVVLAFSIAACKASAPAASTVPEPAQSQPAPAAAAIAPAANGLLSKLSVGMAYGDLRKSLLADGWLPLRDPQCWDNVGGVAAVCNLLPEIESCSGDGYCRAHFAKAPDSVLSLTAYGPYSAWDKTGADATFRLKSFASSRIETTTAECPAQDFDEFLRKFASDTSVQRAYTAPLVKVAEIEDRGDEGYFPRMVYQKASVYSDFDITYANDGFHFVDGRNKRDPKPLPLKIDAPTSDRRDVSFLYATSEGNSYRFDRKDGCWVLTEDPRPPTP